MNVAEARRMLARAARPLTLSVARRAPALLGSIPGSESPDAPEVPRRSRAARGGSASVGASGGNGGTSVSNFDKALCDEMYAFSARLMAEDREHWQHHVDTNDLVHVLRDARTRDLVGFQLWRYDDAARVVWGGKLRFHDSIRRQGIHLLLNLLAIDGREVGGVGQDLNGNGGISIDTDAAHDVDSDCANGDNSDPTDSCYYRVALVNVFGFQALRPALASAYVPPQRLPAVARARIFPALQAFCDDNAFTLCAATGRVDVHQESPRRPGEFDEGFWDRPAVREFRAAGLREGQPPLSREQALKRSNDVFLSWPWDSANISTVRAEALRRLERGQL